jgi:hypothetical protein
MPFNEKFEQSQISWRQNHLPHCTGLGQYKGQERRHILPNEEWIENLWEGIQTSLPKYLACNDVHPHPGKNNLKSSWILAANLYFPFGQNEYGRQLLAGFLKLFLAPEIDVVDRMHLEFESEDESLKPKTLLGETGGSRGQHQTSPDIAFEIKTVSSRKGLILTENKLTERNFEQCSAYDPKPKGDRTLNPDSTRCLRVAELLANPDQQCHQHEWKRKYWNILTPDLIPLQLLPCCPAIYAYQLLRQQALAEGIAKTGQYEFVISSVAYDERNATLLQSLSKLGIKNFSEGWGRLFEGQARFKTFTHQQWCQWVVQNDSQHQWDDWLHYVVTRYDFIDRRSGPS